MGLRDSPCRVLQWKVRLKLVAYGDRRDLANPFHWDHVQLNLPGSPGYRADLPWVMKVRADGIIAAEIFEYVDDGRAIGHSAELAWRAATVDSWRPGREALGFKLRGKELERAMGNWSASRGIPCWREEDGFDEVGPVPRRTQDEGRAHSPDEAPGDVRAVPRLGRDIACLIELTKTPEPPRQLYRAKHVMAFFVIGDASGSGKGVAVVEQYGVDYEAGTWKVQWRKESSNVREAEKLTDRVERLSKESKLFEHEVFVLTDNLAFEGAYYKGHSPSEKLNDIVFRLHKAERDGRFILHVLHIAGKRMKATGVDGLSRGDLTEGMLAGVDPFAFLPFNQGADERANGAVSTWVRSWWRTKKGDDWGVSPWRKCQPRPCLNSRT
jgi:hypothetical protein